MHARTTMVAGLLVFGALSCTNTPGTPTDENRHAAQLSQPPPPHGDRSAALPYRYARVRRGGALSYLGVPSRLAQLLAEPKLRPPQHDARQLGAGANDVARDADGLPSGPPVIRPGSAGVAADGHRWRDQYFEFGPAAPSVTAAVDDGGGSLLGRRLRGLFPETSTLRRGTVVAFTETVRVELEAYARRFAVLPDGRHVPTDQLEPLLGSPWHGIDLRRIGLPVAFTLRRGVRPRAVAGGVSRPLDDEYEPREAIPLSGRFRTVQGERHYRTTKGPWVRARDLILIYPRQSLPDFAVGETKWLDVSLANQYAVAYQGNKPIYATLISSGKSRLGDPENEPATPRGVFRVTAKHLTHGIDGREVGHRHQLESIPWVIETSGDFALCSGIWLWRFGDARGYRNIALPPVDAAWLFRWLSPTLPDHRQSVSSSPDEGGWIDVHK